MSSNQRKPTTRALTEDLLRTGSIELVGRITWSSNFTFLVAVSGEEGTVNAVYKPEEGERPLHDFPSGLHRREVAAYELSQALGWPNIPLTVERDDAPHGPGSLQLFVDANFEEHVFTLLPENPEPFVEVAAFDLLANNADRKSGHCIVDPTDGSIYAIDHGLCFHSDHKLRTVIWDFAGSEIPQRLVDDVRRVCADLPPILRDLLSEDEIDALLERGEAMCGHREFPAPTSDWDFPWPLV